MEPNDGESKNDKSIPPAISYHIRPDDIYVVEINHASEDVVDEWLKILSEIYEIWPKSRTFRYLLRYRAEGVPPISYGANQVRKWLINHADHPITRVAFIHNNSALATLLDGVVRMLRVRRATVRFFLEQREEEAIRWLLED